MNYKQQNTKIIEDSVKDWVVQGSKKENEAMIKLAISTIQRMVNYEKELLGLFSENATVDFMRNAPKLEGIRNISEYFERSSDFIGSPQLLNEPEVYVAPDRIVANLTCSFTLVREHPAFSNELNKLAGKKVGESCISVFDIDDYKIKRLFHCNTFFIPDEV